MADYNRRFAKSYRHDFDAHRPLENHPSSLRLVNRLLLSPTTSPDSTLHTQESTCLGCSLNIF
ncbi:MAG TPA: hypothetical protein DD850_05640 [Erwinia persicina]|nr:hypothetical protein [Erwinia persicina]